MAPQERLIYGDYLVPGAEVRPYTQISDLARLQHLVEEYLEEYNGSSSKPMRLVMFLDAIEHVSRICRVIRLPQGEPSVGELWSTWFVYACDKLCLTLTGALRLI